MLGGHFANTVERGMELKQEKKSQQMGREISKVTELLDSAMSDMCLGEKQNQTV